MGVLYDIAELVVRTMDAHGAVWMLVVTALWNPLLVLVHELGHAGAAESATSGDVRVRVGGRTPLVSFRLSRCEVAVGVVPSGSGSCEYDAGTLRSGRDEAWVALAGPAASLFTCVVLLGVALSLGTSSAAEYVLIGAGVAAAHFLFSVLPIRFGPGSGAAGLDSDGLAAWRILTGGASRTPALDYGRPESGKAVRAPFLAAIAAAALAGFVLDATLGLMVVAVFGAAWLLQSADERGGR